MPRIRSSAVLLVLAGSVLALLESWWYHQRATADNAGMAVFSADRIVYFDATANRPDNVRDDVSSVPESGAVGTVAEMSASDAARFVALCQMRLLAAEADLDLSHDEWARLTGVVTHAQAVRMHYEAGIASVTEIAPGRYRVEIPAYPDAGDELRRRFLAELRETLGEAIAGEVMAKLGSRLEGRFAGFGVSNQTLEITGDPVGAPGDVKVERITHFWNSVKADDLISTRRDVHLPAAEDPMGEQWTPLLALVGKAE